MSLFAEMKYDELNVYIRALRHVITKLTAEHKAETDETKQAALLVQIEAKKTEFKEALGNSLISRFPMEPLMRPTTQKLSAVTQTDAP